MRLAFREEGLLINCYLAGPDNLEGAMLLSCMPIRPLKLNPELFHKWKDLISEVFVFSIKEAMGIEITTMVSKPAPEIERGGNT